MGFENLEILETMKDLSLFKKKYEKSLEILNEIEAIVYSGTKLDLLYIIDDIFDEESKEELHEYLIETKSDNLQGLYDEFNDDFEDEDLRLFMLYFYCEVAF